jgi:hypothetical protein
MLPHWLQQACMVRWFCASSVCSNLLPGVFVASMLGCWRWYGVLCLVLWCGVLWRRSELVLRMLL